MSETTEQRWDREDSGMDKNDRGRPITIGEARIAVENVLDPYDKMIMQFLSWSKAEPKTEYLSVRGLPESVPVEAVLAAIEMELGE